MLKSLLRRLTAAPIALVVLLLCLILPKRRRELIWGPVPLISNKYWACAMREAGWPARTVMSGYFASINRRDDYDTYFDDLVPGWVYPQTVRYLVAPYLALLHVIRHARVVHLPFSGGPLGLTALWRLEAYLLRWAGIRTVLMPYGADAYMYSQVEDPSVRHGLLTNYPDAARREAQIASRVRYWSRHADCMVCGIMLDGMGRSDLPTPSFIQIDTAQWRPKTVYSPHDGISGTVRVLHTPNHRGFKGTEFLVQAVEELRAEGLEIELILLERVPNERVRELMESADILAEQFLIGYALSAIEGMACGLAVMSNLESEFHTRVYRRFAFLDECPILSTSPETLKDNLRVLVRNPTLREQLGRAGREYVQKYHSYETTQYMFGAIYSKILDRKEVDLTDLFHPLKSEFNRRRPRVQHPLVESRLPPKGGEGAPLNWGAASQHSFPDTRGVAPNWM
jgi:hypothetical protein